jgi:hypothetical protein
VTVSKNNGRSVQGEQHPVGTAVTLGPEARAQLYGIENEIRQLLAQLGAHRERFLQEEKRLLEQVASKRNVYANATRSAAAELGIELVGKEGWDFDADQMTLTRVR